MKNRNTFDPNQNFLSRRADLERAIQDLQKRILSQNHQIEETKKNTERDLDELFKDLIAVIDTFDKADKRLNEQFPDCNEVARARKRFATVKRMISEILNRNNVIEIEFPEGKAVLQDCEIDHTETDPSKGNDSIISIEQPGYRRNGRLIRLARVVTVRNPNT